jgi:hypothetical protein
LRKRSLAALHLLRPVKLAVRKAGNLAAALGIAAVDVAVAMFGGADDAPGLVLLGIRLIVSACALGVRSAQRLRDERRPVGRQPRTLR